MLNLVSGCITVWRFTILWPTTIFVIDLDLQKLLSLSPTRMILAIFVEIGAAVLSQLSRSQFLVNLVLTLTSQKLILSYGNFLYDYEHLRQMTWNLDLYFVRNLDRDEPTNQQMYMCLRADFVQPAHFARVTPRWTSTQK